MDMGFVGTIKKRRGEKRRENKREDMISLQPYVLSTLLFMRYDHKFYPGEHQLRLSIQVLKYDSYCAILSNPLCPARERLVGRGYSRGWVGGEEYNTHARGVVSENVERKECPLSEK